MTQHLRSITPVLHTERLTLRGLQMADAPLIKLYVGDFRVARNLTVVPHPYPAGAAEAFIGATIASEEPGMNWAITRAGENELIGVIGLAYKPEGLALGYWLGAPFWGAGLMSEAGAAVVSCCRAGGVPFVLSGAHQDTPASARVLSKLGFHFVASGQEYSLAQGHMVPFDYFRLDLE